MNFLLIIGDYTLRLFESIGKVVVFIFTIFCNIFTLPFYFKIFVKHMVNIGFYCLPVVGMTAIFTGAVLALQIYTGFSRFNAETSVAAVVIISITRELGPVLAGLMVAGRIGASTAAEIATMKVTEQIDALVTLSANPIKYLVLPRILASIIMLPFLVLIADIIGVFGGYLVGTVELGYSTNSYLQSTFENLDSRDIFIGLVKASVFGFIITLMGCYMGYNAKHGAHGVGSATTSSVVSSSMLILLSNYYITELFFSK